MTGSALKTVRIEPRVQARSSVIWLHGLGADGNDFVPIVPELGLPEDAGVRFIFPHAPVRPVTLNGGMPMRAWFDIFGVAADSRLDEVGIKEARSAAEALIDAEISAGIAAERIVVAGFSQGGVVALDAGLHYSKCLAGIMGLSTWLRQTGHFSDASGQANRQTPIFMAHGKNDPTVAPEYGRMSRDALAKAGYRVEWHTYPMGHQVCMDQIKEIGRWLVRVLV